MIFKLIHSSLHPLHRCRGGCSLSALFVIKIYPGEGMKANIAIVIALVFTAWIHA